MPTYDYACAAAAASTPSASAAMRPHGHAADGRCAIRGLPPAAVAARVPAAPASLHGRGTRERHRHQRTRAPRAEDARATTRASPPGRLRLLQRQQPAATVTGTDGAKAFPRKRPWMISH